MEKYINELFTNNLLKEAISRWGGDSHNPKLLGDMENFVYEINHQNENFILRVTHSSHRNESMIKSELEWLNFLLENELTVCKPILSKSNSFVEIITLEDSCFIICAFEKARGVFINSDKSIEQNDALITKLGRLTGKLHLTTKKYKPDGAKRPEWFEEDNVVNSKVYLPETYTKVHNELDNLTSFFKVLDKTNDNYGLIHSDIHGGNFLINGEEIILFDFDDSCYHYFIYDISTIFYSRLLDIKDETERNTIAVKFLKLFLDGYKTENSFDEKWLKMLPELFRLREILIYVFLHKKWDLNNLNEKNQKFFDSLKDRVENNIALIDFNNLHE